MKKLIAFVLVLILVLSLAACGETTPAKQDENNSGNSSSKGLTAEQRKKEFITVGTGPTSGIYFPIGGAFATALQDWGYQTSAEATNATGQNIQNILNKDCEIAIAMQDVCMQAYNATDAYAGKEPASNLRAMMRLWPNYVQLVTTADTGIKSVEDLRGKRVGVGAANSGVEVNARSMQMHVRFGNTTLLLNGDLTGKGEHHYLETLDPKHLESDILKAPHHSLVHMVPEYLDTVNPKFVFLINEKNRAKKSENQLAKRNIPHMYNEDGTITMETDGVDWYISQVKGWN